MPSKDLNLKEFRYKHFDDKNALTAIQFLFENGKESPLFGMASSNDDSLKTINIDTTREIRYVNMRVEKSYKYTGLRFADLNNITIVEESWVDSGEWTP